jgi:hypothetical protein
MKRKIFLENINTIKKAKVWKLQVTTGTLAVVTHSIHLKIMRVAAERRVVVVVVVVVGGGGRMTRSITLTIEKRRLEFDGVWNKGNTDLLTFTPHKKLVSVSSTKISLT